MKHTSESILIAGSEFYNIPVYTISNKARKRHIVHARYVIMYLIRKRVFVKYREMSEIFPDLYSDHTGFVHAIKQIKRELTLPKVFSTQEEIAYILQLSFQKSRQLEVA
jgi:chromosomal replication initiation ATPase DnaA